MTPAFTWDIETEDWTTFVVGGLFETANGKYRRFRHTEEREYVDALLSMEGEGYAHNGGRYDDLWLLDAVRRFGIKREMRVATSSLGIVSLRIGDATFLDSWRIFPMPLRELTAGAKHTLADLCSCAGKNCGGYCAIRRDMSRRVRAQVEDYLEADCRELAIALQHMQGIADECQLEIGMTVGSTAWKSAQAELGLDDSCFESLARWRWVRESYFGGRVEPFRRRADDGWEYDVNSMYPAMIATVPLPIGDPVRTFDKKAAHLLASGQDGAYSATVTVPEMFVPPLPVRIGTRTVYPFGRFDGIWTGVHLRYAQSVGCRIERVHEAVAWPSSQVLFRSWVDRLFDIRMRYGKDTREGVWIKFLMNSLTGKFGTRCEIRSLIFNPEEVKDCICGGGHECTCGAYRPVGGMTDVFESVIERLHPCAYPQWASTLTAAAACELHRQLTAGGDDACYCDTDSAFVLNRRTRRVGKKLGEWSEKGNFRTWTDDAGSHPGFEALAPKVYRVNHGGKVTVRAKGIPSPSWAQLCAGEAVKFKGIAGIRRSQEGRFFVRVEQSRTVSENIGGRELIANGPETRPLDYAAAVRKFGGRKGSG